jgi:hypothetical protein
MMKLQERLTFLQTIPASLARTREAGRPPRTLVALALPVVLSAVIIIRRQRRATQPATPASLNGSSPSRTATTGRPRHRPRSIVRYYTLGLLISLLERESTRKALLSALRAARNHA